MTILASILFIISPILSMPVVLLGLFLEKKHKRYYCFLLSVMIGIICYYIVPNQGMDISRYYEYLDEIRYLPITEALKGISSQTEIITNLFFYVISQLNNNSLVVFFSSLIYYNILFYIIIDYCKIKDLTNKQINMIIIYAMITIWIIPNILGIRYAIAMVVFLLAIYLDMVKQKKNIIYKLLYILPILIHSSTILFLIMRLILLISNRKTKILIIAIIVLISATPDFIFTLTQNLPGANIVESVSKSVQNYLIDGKETFENINLLKIGLAIGFAFALYGIKEKVPKENKLYNYTVLMLVLSLAFCYSPTLSIRLIDFTNLLFILMLIEIGSIKDLLKAKNNIITFYFIIMLLISLRTQIIYFKQPESYNNLIPDKIATNVFSIFNKEEE
ncbi:MAG: EpsG family protein [Clostridia bacterium]|jgi:hypothetical protein|nr:EpsG family protein [Clostridia bacterium]